MTTAIAPGAEPSFALENGAQVRPAIEFLLVGGATLLLLPSLWLLRKAIGLDSAELAVGFLMFHGAHLINDPHFAVSYLLFYKDVIAVLQRLQRSTNVPNNISPPDTNTRSNTPINLK
jgi:hypothetical protein